VTTRSAKADPGEVGGGAAGGEGKAKNTGCGERVAGSCDRTLSRPCLVSKRKNFVSRARTTERSEVVLSGWEAKVSWDLFRPASGSGRASF
jgi:hypothetical protein